MEPEAEIIRTQLFALRDETYRTFHSALMPTVPPETVIGVRVPALRRLAKQLAGTAQAEVFLQALPHGYYEENNLHAFLIELIRDYDRALAETEAFLPYINNWATCDCFCPKVFAKHKKELLVPIRRWLDSGEVYTVRYGMEMLMRYYLDDAFRPEYLEWVADVHSTEYYINMMRAWYFATALAKQPDAALPWLTERRLDVWTHNKTIQKDNRPPAKKQTVCLYHSLRFLQQTALFYFPSTIFFSLSIRMIVSSTVRTAHMIVLSPATQPTISWNPITSSASATAIAIPETVLITRIFCAISMET